MFRDSDPDLIDFRNSTETSLSYDTFVVINQSIYLHQTTWIHITIKENKVMFS